MVKWSKYQTNGNLRDEHYYGKLLFTIKYFVTFGKYGQSVYLISTRFLKDKINVVCVPQFQLAFNCDTTHPSHKNLVKLCLEVHYMWWETCNYIGGRIKSCQIKQES